MSVPLLMSSRVQEPSTPPSSPPRRSLLDDRIGGIREELELRSSPDKTPLSPKRPPRDKFKLLSSVSEISPGSSVSEISPGRGLLVQRLETKDLLRDSELGLSGIPGKIGIMARVVSAFSKTEEKKSNPDTAIALQRPFSAHTELSITSKPIHTRSSSREVNRRDLSELITRCEGAFFKYAQDNSEKELNFIEFKPAFGVFRDLLLKLENKDFLDQYIVRDSQVGANKDLKQQEALDAFHAKVLKLRDELKKIGINSLEEGGSINFWSGKEGQQRAADDTCSFSDSDIPFFKFLFDCWGHIKSKELSKPNSNPFLTSLLPNLFSAIFASHAKGEVNVYMASKNDPSTDSSVINIDSAFWGAELYHLTNNVNVTKVNLYLHMGKDDEDKDKWSLPIDLKSHDKNVVDYRDSIICVSKRDDTSLKVPMGALRNVGLTWKEKAFARKLLTTPL